MKTIAILSQKGGTGKTTLALHLAVCAEAAGHTAAVIDLDPQSSAAGWSESRSGEGPTVAIAHAPRLLSILEAAASNGASLAILDTAPHSQGDALAAAQAADAILIPCRPGILDLRAIGATVQIAKLAGKPVAVVLNACPPQGRALADEAEEAVKGYGVPVAPVRLVQRAAFAHSLAGGQTAPEYEPQGKAAEEIQQLYEWACQFVGMPARQHEGKNDKAPKSRRRTA
jgi:chromosome partitioning protein